MLRRGRVFEHIRGRRSVETCRYLVTTSREVLKTIGCPVSMTVSIAKAVDITWTNRYDGRDGRHCLALVAASPESPQHCLHYYPNPTSLLPAVHSMAGILSPKSDNTALSVNPATAAATDLSVPSALQRTPQTEAVRTQLIVMVFPPLMNAVNSRISS